MKPFSVLAVLLLATLGACQSAWYPHRFGPAPLDISLDSERVTEARGRALVTVLGIRRADSSAGTPERVEVRMRLENTGARTLAVVPESFELVSAALESFQPPSFSGLPSAPLAQGESATFEVYFPLPEGSTADRMGLAGLNLKWLVDFEGERVGTGVTFERRVDPYPYAYWYYDPFYGPYYWPYYDPWCFHSHVTIGYGHED